MVYVHFMEMAQMLTSTQPKFNLLDVGDNLKVGCCCGVVCWFWLFGVPC